MTPEEKKLFDYYNGEVEKLHEVLMILDKRNPEGATTNNPPVLRLIRHLVLNETISAFDFPE